jgi:hypothetical protein
MLGSDYPFLDVFWTMLVFFVWVVWFWLLITVFADIFRRHDISGWGKTGWLIFTIVLPFLGVFIYLISQHDGMDQRNIERAQAERAQLDDYVRQTAGGGGAAAEIDKAKQLLDSGAISQSEYEALKQKALA